MPTRVALVASSYHPHLGGVESHVRHVASELRAAGTDVEVWTVDRGEHLGTTELDDIRVRHLPTPMPARSVGAMARFALAAPGAWRAWRSAQRSFRPDVLHVQCFGPNGLYAAALARRARLPLVLSSHGETFMDDHDAFGTSALLRRGLREAISAATVTTGCSQEVLDDLRDRFGLVGGVVVPNGVGPAPEQPSGPPRRGLLGLGAGDRVVFAVGRLERMKGFDLLVDAVAALDDPSVTLVVAGSGSQADPLAALAQSRGLGDRFRLVGPLDEAGVDAWMRDAQVVAMPSRREAFGIVALEAWRAGSPLVATSLGGPSTFVQSGVDGLVVDPRDTATLAAALRRVLDDRAFAASLAAAGRRSVEAFTWTRVARDYTAIYASAVVPPSGPSGPSGTLPSRS
ncbi:glycosyltransferase family 4 protein [Humibacillus xanthopallidus]|uniref:D-inositol 3-phosphate glycosyltransferase n=1 Tax=Humibacillus xanthopallidus TaxID=412689 RepID=A0A543I070_9MICO|nr:glycosyltransferase family 4 protein [Humibacillus xanthopallidus]TQM63997.1 glycosyltransferase involved in cell wall biosynthesis [Humibacillus xanthopallidus]